MSNGNSTEYGYRVEIRDDIFTARNPLVLQDGVVTDNWREVDFQQGFNPAGVPVDDIPWGHKVTHRILPLESATALAWTIIAQYPNRYGLQVRLAQYKLEVTFKIERQGVIEQAGIERRIGPPKIITETEQVTTVSTKEQG